MRGGSRALLGLLAIVALGVPGCAASPLRGTEVVWEVDLGDHTVRIGDRRYHVTPHTRVYGPRGERWTIRQIPTARSTARRGDGGTLADFRASDRDGRLILSWIKAAER
jgi:hypothetical protein